MCARFFALLRQMKQNLFECSMSSIKESEENEQCNVERKMKDVCGNEFRMAKELFIQKWKKKLFKTLKLQQKCFFKL
jgi:hypothetical protein